MNINADHTPMITDTDNINPFVAATKKLDWEINDDIMLTGKQFKDDGRDFVNSVSTIFNNVLNITFKGMIQ